ncbi:hypothetical protein SAMN05444149_103116 [Pseudosulfitobacter pseudonitzschiae]|uniref:DUF2946 domain-containing protein n=1 Tax=Pseudosulfitobacter pseudonitzschiae TaxID=1402135 RepID=A0A073J044_9RHOB|nr:hypothetical protein SUH3_23420 [Pseudosulfitobacter pseudonitzschiae]SHF18495.1 hypothetical protein SAMN05444149_103116 [Pseudosulfitobacter pseudonitzschiae]
MVSFVSRLSGKSTALIRAVHVLLFVAFSCLTPGTMPVAQAGGFTLVLCTGDGTTTVTLDAGGNPVQAQHDRCDWSAGVAQAVLHSPLMVPAALQIRAYVPTFQTAALVAGQQGRTQNHTRGPPILL